MEKDTRPLFQITEAAHACGLSRSTLLRMEEKGLLAPAYIAPDSGRRYYDNHNVARVLQIEKLKVMGLGTEEIAGYFAHGGEVTDLLSMLEERLRELSRGVEELRLRAGGSGGLSIQLMTLPAVTCCTRRCEGHTIAEKYNAMYDFYGQCVRQGCRLSREPIFIISERTDYLESRIGDTPYPFHVCVPVRPENAPKEAVTLPECRAQIKLYFAPLIRNLPEGLSPEREAVVRFACSLVGKANYFWGGKSLVIGWDARWGELRQITAAGSTAIAPIFRGHPHSPVTWCSTRIIPMWVLSVAGMPTESC